MKSYPYNREGAEGRRLFKLLDVQFNPGVLDSKQASKAFETYNVFSVMQCRVNRATFLFPSNLAGIQRPQIRVESDVEMAWGEFTKDITAMDFTSGDEDLPLVYTQPIDDDTMKYLIDAGLYSDPKFERLISKLMTDELFDAEAEMQISYVEIQHEDTPLQILMADPVDVMHIENDPSERTTLADLVKRSAALVIDLRKEGVNADQVMQIDEPSQDAEVFIPDTFEDVVQKQEEAEVEMLGAADADEFSTSSDLLDAEIDVTEKLKGTFGIDTLTEDDRIRKLKDRETAAFDNESNDDFDLTLDNFDEHDVIADSVETAESLNEPDLDDDMRFDNRNDEDDLSR